jgi:hypothetical protein
VSQASLRQARPRQGTAVALTTLALLLSVGAYVLVGLGSACTAGSSASGTSSPTW